MRKNEIKQSWEKSTLKMVTFLTIVLLFFLVTLIFIVIRIPMLWKIEDQSNSVISTFIALLVSFIIVSIIFLLVSILMVILNDHITQKRCLEKLKTYLSYNYKIIKVNPDGIPEYADIILSCNVLAKIDKTDVISIKIENIDGVISEFSTINYKWFLSSLLIL